MAEEEEDLEAMDRDLHPLLHCRDPNCREETALEKAGDPHRQVAALAMEPPEDPRGTTWRFLPITTTLDLRGSSAVLLDSEAAAVVVVGPHRPT